MKEHFLLDQSLVIPEGEDNKSNGRKRAHQHKRHGQSRDTDKTEHTRHRTNKLNYSEE
jgi:hypothetical protein